MLDLRIGEDSGLDVLASMRQAGVQTPTLMITAYGSIRNAVRAMQLGAIDFLEKPIEPVALRKIVAEILDRHQPRTVRSRSRQPRQIDCAKPSGSSIYRTSTAAEMVDRRAEDR